MKNAKEKTLWFVIFNSPSGCERQFGTDCWTREEAQEIADTWNADRDCRYGVYEVSSMKVLVKDNIVI